LRRSIATRPSISFLKSEVDHVLARHCGVDHLVRRFMRLVSPSLLAHSLSQACGADAAKLRFPFFAADATDPGQRADRLLSSELGNVFGLLAAAAVVFFMAPLQRFAERVASTAIPNTQNTPEYTAFRKLQVYEAAVAEALQGGGISQKERALLIRLRDTLGISTADADTRERELQTRTDVPGP
jgi:hypothetical protein